MSPDEFRLIARKMDGLRGLTHGPSRLPRKQDDFRDIVSRWEVGHGKTYA